MTPLPSLRQLRYLVALVEHRHFGHAAAACSVTQSTLSAAIQELENLLGVSLVERSKRHVLITPLGTTIATRAARVLREAEDLVGSANVWREPLSGTLRLGVIPTIGPYLLPRLMLAARQAFPQLRLYVREEQTAGLIDKLASGQLDLLVIALPFGLDETVEVEEIGEDEILVACPADHPFATLDRVESEALRSTGLLMLEDGHCLRSHALTACGLAGADHNEVFQGTGLRTLVQMVAAGLGVTLLPRLAVETELSSAEGAVQVRPIGPGRHARRIALAWRRSSARKAEFRRLGNFAAALLAP